MRGLRYTPAKNGETRINRSGDVEFVTFPAFDGHGVLAAFSSKAGGVSEGVFAEMNLGRMEEDDIEKVKENYRIFGKAVGFKGENVVVSAQEHLTNVKVATSADCGKGCFVPADYDSIDAFVTNERGVPIAVLTADCVPVYVLDPVNNAIGLAHAGWPGTCNRIAARTVEALVANYGSKPEDLIVVLGPSICGECFEEIENFYSEFSKVWTEDELKQIFTFKETADGTKPFLDARKANVLALTVAGVKEENIHISDICTACNPDNFFSHKAHDWQRGSQAAVMMLK